MAETAVKQTEKAVPKEKTEKEMRIEFLEAAETFVKGKEKITMLSLVSDKRYALIAVDYPKILGLDASLLGGGDLLAHVVVKDEMAALKLLGITKNPDKKAWREILTMENNDRTSVISAMARIDSVAADLLSYSWEDGFFKGLIAHKENGK